MARRVLKLRPRDGAASFSQKFPVFSRQNREIVPETISPLTPSTTIPSYVETGPPRHLCKEACVRGVAGACREQRRASRQHFRQDRGFGGTSLRDVGKRHTIEVPDASGSRRRRRGIRRDGAAQPRTAGGNERRIVRIEHLDHLGEVGKRPREPIDLVHDNDVHPSDADLVQQPGERRTLRSRNRSIPPSLPLNSSRRHIDNVLAAVPLPQQPGAGPQVRWSLRERGLLIMKRLAQQSRDS